MENEKVVIIGGGVIGCATAYMLKKSSPNSQVLLLDRNSGVGHECSYQNGGTLSYSFIPPWNFPSIIRSAVFGSNTSFYSINSSVLFSPSFWFWACRAVYSSWFPSTDGNLQLFNLGKRSAELQTTLRKELLGISSRLNFEYLGNDLGLIVFYSTLHDFNKAKTRSLDLNNKQGIYINVLPTRKSCSRYEQSINEWGMEVVGCVKNHSEYLSAHDSYKLSLSLMQLAVRNGAVFQCDAEVDTFNVKDGKLVSVTLKSGQTIIGDKFVLCTGAESRTLGKKLGWAPPIWPAKGLTFNMKTSKEFNHTLYLYNDFPTYVTPLDKNLYRVSSFVEFTEVEDHSVDPEKVKYLEKRVTESLSIKDAEFSSYWSCKRPVSSDDLPIIGLFPGLQNVYINAGHGSKGCILSLSSAELVTHILMKKQPLVDPRPFAPERFLV